MAIIKVVKEIEIVICDICKKEITNRYYRCVICGKVMHDGCESQWTEDGSVCPLCYKKGYRIKQYENGTVGAKLKGKNVHAPYL